jgi:hypothetical protein
VTGLQLLGGTLVAGVFALVFGLTVACEGWRAALAIWVTALVGSAALIAGLLLLGVR